MQKSRKFVLVVSLSAAIVLGAGMNGTSAKQRTYGAGSANSSVIDTIVDFIVLASRILIPPG